MVRNYSHHAIFWPGSADSDFAGLFRHGLAGLGPDGLEDATFRGRLAERLTGWLAGPHDADHWRAKAGLPPQWVL
ncbi:hypothetical protein [Streptomyces sp. CB00455]|uniref:hypothetical protein n=1 Tax=Streptomyces sp. CB00455 TaxID=1703927 RepID=UPI00093C88BE|nr:hypothetical protein [Streptomyces sp. CB00455]